MVFIVLTEANPVAAMKALLVRCSYVLIPFSVVMIKYFPDLGRAYNPWTGLGYYSGVATDKNQLGMVLTPLGISVFWALLTLHDEPPRPGKKAQGWVYVAILGMTIWLLMKANSATAVTCTTAGILIFVLVRLHVIARHGWAWLTFGAVGAALLTATGLWTQLQAHVIDMLGRDPTLTGRSDIWEAVLGETTNPIIGTGFYSFWTGDRIQRLSASYHYLLNEAHNGYLETYLNGGLIGLVLLGMLLLSTARRSLSALAAGVEREVNGYRLAFVFFAAVYNLSEAVVNRLNLVWLGLLLMTCIYTQRHHSGADREVTRTQHKGTDPSARAWQLATHHDRKQNDA